MKNALVLCLFALTVIVAYISFKSGPLTVVTILPYIITIISLGITAWQVETTKQIAALQNKQALEVTKMQNEQALKLAKIAHNSTIVSNNRIQYLKEVRETAVEISAFLKSFSFRYTIANEKGKVKEFIDNQVESLEKSTSLYTKMTLLLNPNEPETPNVISLLEALSKLSLEEVNLLTYNSYMAQFNDTMQIILKKNGNESRQ